MRSRSFPRPARALLVGALAAWGLAAADAHAEDPTPAPAPRVDETKETAGYVLATAGTITMPVGAVFAVLKVVEQRKARDLCDGNDPCTNSEGIAAQDATDAYLVTSASVMLGGLGMLATGLFLLATSTEAAPDNAGPRAVGVSPWFGPTGAGMTSTLRF